MDIQQDNSITVIQHGTFLLFGQLFCWNMKLSEADSRSYKQSIMVRSSLTTRQRLH